MVSPSVDGDTTDDAQLTAPQHHRVDPVVVAWVERSCQAQGIPVKIRDAGVIEQIRVLLTAGRSDARDRAAR